MNQSRKIQLIVLGSLGFLAMWAVADKATKGYGDAMITILDSAPEQLTEEIEKTKEVWEQELSPVEFHVLREAGTEPPNGKIYKQFKDQEGGVYYCAGCGAELFSSKEKFDSGSGWPSFYAPSAKDNIKLDIDHKLGYKRTEIRCNKCDGHLGHVFEGEGYKTPTDERYCVNGVCLKFLPEGAEKEK